MSNSSWSHASALESLEVIERRARRAGGEPVFAAAVDRSRLFLCPTLTPMYYAPIYHELSDAQRLRYNQLTGLSFNELVAFFEESFAASVLAAVSDQQSRDDGDPRLTACLDGFIRDERRHTAYWRRLNRLTAPEWYATSERVVVRLSPIARFGLQFLTRRPRRCPAVFWIMLALEERSLEISRRCLAVDDDQIEPTYRSVYQHHMRDESRHVELDRHLIERFYTPAPASRRARNARLFITMLARFFLPPVRSAVRVVKRLSDEFPQLRPRLPEFTRQLRKVGNDADYHEMMYSRASTPLLFDLLDRFEEMHGMQTVLKSYTPNAASPELLQART